MGPDLVYVISTAFSNFWLPTTIAGLVATLIAFVATGGDATERTASGVLWLVMPHVVMAAMSVLFWVLATSTTASDQRWRHPTGCSGDPQDRSNLRTMSRNRALVALLLTGAAVLTAGCSGDAEASATGTPSAAEDSPGEQCWQDVQDKFSSDAHPAQSIPFGDADGDGVLVALGEYDNPSTGLKSTWSARCEKQTSTLDPSIAYWGLSFFSAS